MQEIRTLVQQIREAGVHFPSPDLKRIVAFKNNKELLRVRLRQVNRLAELCKEYDGKYVVQAYILGADELNIKDHVLDREIWIPLATSQYFRDPIKHVEELFQKWGVQFSNILTNALRACMESNSECTVNKYYNHYAISLIEDGIYTIILNLYAKYKPSIEIFHRGTAIHSYTLDNIDGNSDFKPHIESALEKARKHDG